MVQCQCGRTKGWRGRIAAEIKEKSDSSLSSSWQDIEFFSLAERTSRPHGRGFAFVLYMTEQVGISSNEMETPVTA